ncbi:MAG: hypothetical protein QXK89_02410 [Candidatus Bathyarchaeia archaeon]
MNERQLMPCIFIISMGIIFGGIIFGIAFTSINAFFIQTKRQGIGIGEVSYAFYYESFRDAYDKADLVVVGKVIRVEYYCKPIAKVVIQTAMGPLVPCFPWTLSSLEVETVIKGELTNKTIIVSQAGGISYGVFALLPEDPPLKIGERVLLFLIKSELPVKYEEEFGYHGPFGRFEVIDGKVYSLMYGLPEELEDTRVKCREAAENILTAFPHSDYKDVNGIPLEDFIKILTTGKP